MGNILGPLTAQALFTLQGILQRPGGIRDHIELHNMLAVHRYGTLSSRHTVQGLGKETALFFQRLEKQERQQCRHSHSNQERPDKDTLGGGEQGGISFDFGKRRQVYRISVEQLIAGGPDLPPLQILHQAVLQTPAPACAPFSLAV